ncbi:MAG: DUF2752 domain-containing protein [Bacteroidota bacterium]
MEWVTFSGALVAFAFMNPDVQSTSFCFFDWIGFPFCPGEGLGHSIAFLLDGHITESFEAHLLGPFAVGVLSARIIYLWQSLWKNHNQQMEITHG